MRRYRCPICREPDVLKISREPFGLFVFCRNLCPRDAILAALGNRDEVAR